jgi:chromosome segregation ATPase
MVKPSELAKDIAAHCPDNLAQVRAQLQTLERNARSERTYTAAEVNEAVRTLERKEKAEGELRGLERNLEEKIKAAKDLERSTLKRVDRLIESVGTKFSELMARMGNVGSIKLQKGDDQLDFKSYGLIIMVKFAGHRGEMQKLANNVQSGGEKSVTTALYMMALQELSVVPFALLDEINQGNGAHMQHCCIVIVSVWLQAWTTRTRGKCGRCCFKRPPAPEHSTSTWRPSSRSTSSSTRR